MIERGISDGNRTTPRAEVMTMPLRRVVVKGVWESEHTLLPPVVIVDMQQEEVQDASEIFPGFLATAENIASEYYYSRKFNALSPPIFQI